MLVPKDRDEFFDDLYKAFHESARRARLSPNEAVQRTEGLAMLALRPLTAGVEPPLRGGSTGRRLRAAAVGPLARPNPRLEPPIPPARERACGLAAQPPPRWADMGEQ